MKKRIIGFMGLCAVIIGSQFVMACSGQDAKNDAKPAANTTKNADAKALPNYRYVDVDSVLAKYNLSKDYNEEMMRMQNNLESTLRQKQQSLESMAAGFQKKAQNNQYTSEAEYKRDQQTFADAQNRAQNEASSLQENFAKQADQMQKAVSDSIESYIKIYNAKHHYDAIFMKAATLYIDPALDITDEVVKGLNERYNKVK